MHLIRGRLMLCVTGTQHKKYYWRVAEAQLITAVTTQAHQARLAPLKHETRASGVNVRLQVSRRRMTDASDINTGRGVECDGRDEAAEPRRAF